MTDIEITGVETAVAATPRGPWIFVRVETDEGITGYGEAGRGGSPADVVTTVDALAEDLVGRSPFHTEGLFAPIGPVGGGASPRNERYTRALSAIDIACWDVKGKYFGVPVYELLGGPVDGTSLRAYANSWFGDVYEDGVRQPERFAEAAETVVAAGYDAMKFCPFANHWKRMDRGEFNRSIDCVRAIREAVGPDVDLFVEGHKRFSVPVAIEIARELEPYQVAWFEEPTSPSATALGKVADKSPVPIATGESLITHHAFPELLHETAVGIVQPDVAHTGGITNLRKIATIADAEHAELAPHSASGWILGAASIHVGATVPNFCIQETFQEFGYPEMATDIVDEPLRVEDGHVEVPDRPGLGVDLEWEVIREKYAYEDHGDEYPPLDLYEYGWEAKNRE